jgi:hypothetical protein
LLTPSLPASFQQKKNHGDADAEPEPLRSNPLSNPTQAPTKSPAKVNAALIAAEDKHLFGLLMQSPVLHQELKHGEAVEAVPQLSSFLLSRNATVTAAPTTTTTAAPTTPYPTSRPTSSPTNTPTVLGVAMILGELDPVGKSQKKTSSSILTASARAAARLAALTAVTKEAKSLAAKQAKAREMDPLWLQHLNHKKAADHQWSNNEEQKWARREIKVRLDQKMREVEKEKDPKLAICQNSKLRTHCRIGEAAGTNIAERIAKSGGERGLQSSVIISARSTACRGGEPVFGRPRALFKGEAECARAFDAAVYIAEGSRTPTAYPTMKRTSNHSTPTAYPTMQRTSNRSTPTSYPSARPTMISITAAPSLLDSYPWSNSGLVNVPPKEEVSVRGNMMEAHCSTVLNAHDLIGRNLQKTNCSGDSEEAMDASCCALCVAHSGCEFWVRENSLANNYCWLKKGFIFREGNPILRGAFVGVPPPNANATNMDD